jgi:hypothetical protein
VLHNTYLVGAGVAPPFLGSRGATYFNASLFSLLELYFTHIYVIISNSFRAIMNMYMYLFFYVHDFIWYKVFALLTYWNQINFQV